MATIRPLLMTILATALLAAGAPRAHAEPVKCQRAIVKHADKLAQAVAKALRACEEKKRSGKLASATVCLLESKTAGKIAAAEAALRAQLDKQCGGGDKTCGTGGDDDALAAIGWPSACPDFEGLGCTNAIDECADVAECLRCVHRSAAVQAIELAYGELVPADKKTERALFKCQSTLAGELVKYHALRSKTLGKCWDTRLQGKHANACPAPGDGKAAAKIAQGRAAFVAKVCRACGGTDKACGGAADLAPGVIVGLAACPAVESCGGPIGTLAELAECFACVAEFESDCASALTVPALAGYPAGCAAPVVPVVTPTPTMSPQPSVTPTATVPGAPTVSATPTVEATGGLEVTPTATVTSTATAGGPTTTPTAGPSPVPCPVANPGSVTTDASITLTASQAVGAATLLLGYPPNRVGLPAAGGAATVRARVTDLTGGELFDKGSPNNQDSNADLISDRVRFSLVSTSGVLGEVLTVRFDRCDGALTTIGSDFACTLQNVVATDGITPIAGASCATGVAH